MNDRYRILSADNECMLAMYVNQAMRDGWTPQGGVAVVYGNCRNVTTYSQAMVKP